MVTFKRGRLGKVKLGYVSLGIIRASFKVVIEAVYKTCDLSSDEMSLID